MRQSIREIGRGGICPVALPVVETMTLKETGFDDVTVSMPADKAHFAPTGAPVQDMEIFPVNPVPGLSNNAYCAV